MNNKEQPLKLSPEEREELVQLLEGQGWPALLRVISALVQQQERRVLTFSLSGATAPQELMCEKARAEGAQTLINKINQIKEQYRPQ